MQERDILREAAVGSTHQCNTLAYNLLRSLKFQYFSCVLQDIQQALSAIRGEMERFDAEIKYAALELMLSASNSVVELAKKMAKPETVTRTVAVPKTKIVKQPTPPHTTLKGTERIDFAPIRPQPPLPNQQGNRDKR